MSIDTETSQWLADFRARIAQENAEADAAREAARTKAKRRVGQTRCTACGAGRGSLATVVVDGKWKHEECPSELTPRTKVCPSCHLEQGAGESCGNCGA